MADADLFERIKITEKGAVCLGDSVVCDGFESGFHAAAFTHMPDDDRMDMFGTCMHYYPVYTSKLTADLLAALMDDTYSRRVQFHAVDYDAPQNVGLGGRADRLKLLGPSHLLGSSQALLTTHDGLKMLYSGNISRQDLPPKCDVLAIGSARGNLNLAEAELDSMEQRLADAVLESMGSQKPVCIHAHRVELLRIMLLLSEHEDMPADVRFLASKIDTRVAEIYKKRGHNTRDLVDLHSYEGEEITTCEHPWVEFTASMEQTPRERKGRVSKISVDGSWNVAMKQDDKEIWTAPGEQAEFADILKYVKAAEPRAVVTDGRHAPYGERLAGAIKSNLGIEARHMPG